MIAITLFSPRGAEQTLLPEGQLEAAIGVRLYGAPVAFFRSGWLYPADGLGFFDGGRYLPGPKDATKALTLTLRGPGLQTAVAVRPAETVECAVSLAGIDSFSVGHASANDLVYKDVLVSSCHGRFSRNGRNGFVYKDMSANGSFVNGRLVHNTRVALPEGAEVLIPPMLRIRIAGDELRYLRPAGMKDSKLDAAEENDA